MFTLDGEINSVFDIKNTIDDRLYFKIDTNMNQRGNIYIREAKLKKSAFLFGYSEESLLEVENVVRYN